MAAYAPTTAQGVAQAMRQRERAVGVMAGALGILVGVAAASLILGSPIGLVVALAVAAAVVVWIAPWTGVVAVALIATIIEQFSLVSEGTLSDGTDRIPLFASLNASGLGGLYASPFELFLAFLIVVWLIKDFATRRLHLPRSPLSLAVGAFALLVAIGWVRGVAGGGTSQVALLEVRPWLYLTIAFIVSSQLITSRKQLAVLLGAMAAGIAVKGVQGVVAIATHFSIRSTQAILAHEESFFFGLYMALLAGLWLVPIRGRLRTFMTAAFPFVLVADVANQRRTAWAIAAVALLTVFVICYFAVPSRRKAIVMLAMAGAMLAGIYWAAFSNDPGLLGQPARAVLSQLNPSARDQSSNQYRVIENVNLGVAIRNSMPFGTGFGHPIPQQVPNVDISNVDSFISYLPHDGLLYVWLRLGLPGIVAFWMMVGVALMTAVNSFRRRTDAVTRIISLALMAAVMSYIVQGYYDMGLYWFRIALIMGCLMGALGVARNLDTLDRAAEPHPEHRTVVVERAKRGLQSAA